MNRRVLGGLGFVLFVAGGLAAQEVINVTFAPDTMM